MAAALLPYAIGVNLHVDRRGRTMTNAALVAGLTDCGFRYVRLGSHLDDTLADTVEIANGLTDIGVECTWVGTNDAMLLRAAARLSNTGLHSALENLNENSAGYEAAYDRTYELDVLRRRTGLAHAQILYPSTTTDWDERLQYRSGLPFSTTLNLHFYAGPAGTMDTPRLRDGLEHFSADGFGQQRKWLTENGIKHSANPPGPASDAQMPDDAAAAVLVRNALFAVSCSSVEKYAVYLYNDEPGSDGTGDGGTYGLVDPDGTPKASYLAFKALFDLVRDDSPFLTAPIVDYAVATDGDVYHLPISHSDGRAFIAFWQYQSVIVSHPDGDGTPWPSGALVQPAAVPVTFTPSVPYSQALLHDLPSTVIPAPMIGAAVHTSAVGSVRVLELRP